jgi:His/Glu/Gln/Arg/opine family amino acid ABC transporter permease subunit
MMIRVVTIFVLYLCCFSNLAIQTKISANISTHSAGIVASFPIGVLLALGRQSKMPVIRFLSVVYIEFIRGLPLITILFMLFVGGLMSYLRCL